MFSFSKKRNSVYFRLRKAHTGETNGSDGIPGTERELDIRNVIFEGFLMETPANDASCVKDNGEIQEVDLSLPHGDEVAENVEVLKSDVSVTEDKSNNLTCESGFICSAERNLSNGGFDFCTAYALQIYAPLKFDRFRYRGCCICPVIRYIKTLI